MRSPYRLRQWFALAAALPLAALAQAAPVLASTAFTVDSRPGTPAHLSYREQTQNLTVGCPADLAIAATAAVTRPGQIEAWLQLPDGTHTAQFNTHYAVSGALPYLLPLHGAYLLKGGALDGELRYVINLRIDGATTPLQVSRPFSVTCLRPDTPSGLYNLRAQVTGSDASGHGASFYADPANPLAVKARVVCPANLSLRGEVMSHESGRAQGRITLDNGELVAASTIPVAAIQPADGGLPHVQGIGGSYQLHPGQSYQGGLHLAVEYPDGGVTRKASAVVHFDVVCQ